MSAPERGIVMRRAGAVWVVALVLLAACTPMPSAPSPSPSPVQTSGPPETKGQRQERLDYEAAERAYRGFNAELNRVLQAGGAKEATAAMKKAAAGPYLKTFTELVKGFHQNDGRQVGSNKITELVRAGYSDSELLLNSCEDGRSAILYRAGKKVGSGDLRKGQLTLRKVDGVWKIWEGDARRVSEC